MFKTRESRDFWLLAVLALLVIGAGIGLRDPWPADEPRFALVAKQMVESGNWLFPHRGTELYSDKPPMLMWLQAGCFELLRNWRIAFLLPSLLASLGTLWCVYDLGKRLWTPRVGFFAGMALLFAFQFTYQAKKAQIDPLVAFWITLANYGLLRHLLSYRDKDGPNWPMWWLGWFAAGLGTITKGVGILALAMLLPACFAAWRDWPRIALHARHWKFWIAPLFFVLAVAIWLAPMLTAALTSADPSYRAYLDDILFRQTAKRYAHSWDHPQPPWYHLEVMAFAWLPTVLALPWAIPAWRRRLRRRDPRYLLPIVWWLLVIGFFSIPHGKRDVYIMPALPMLCLALGPLLPGIVRKRVPRTLALVMALALAVVPLALGLAMLLGNPAFEQKFTTERGFVLGAAPIAWTLAAMGVAGFASIVWFGLRRPVQALLGVLVALWVIYGTVAAPLLNDSSSSRGLMRDVDKAIGPRAALGMVAWKEQNLLMSDRPTATFGFQVPWTQQLQAGVAWLAQAPDQRVLLVQEPALSQCVDRARARFAGWSNRRRYWLVPYAAVIPDCTPTGIESQNEADGQDDD